MLDKKFLTISTLLVVMLFFVAQSFSQEDTNNRRAGTAAAQELLIPIGSRITAMGGGYVAGVSGIESIYWNPAGLATSEAGTEVIFNHLNWISDLTLNYVAASAKFGNIGTFGVSIATMGFGENIAVTTVGDPDGTGETFSPTFLTFGVTYSRAMTDRISAGFNIKVVSEDIFEQTASTVGFDFGVQYKAGDTGFSLGAMLKNIGPRMTFDGPKSERITNVPGQEPGTRPRPLAIPLLASELPSSLELGVAYNVDLAENSSVTIVGNFRNNNFTFDEYQIGGEYNFSNFVYLRGGYTLQYNSEGSSFASNSIDNIYGASLGGGVFWQIAPNISVRFDYAWRQAEFFDSPQWFSFTLGF